MRPWPAPAILSVVLLVLLGCAAAGGPGAVRDPAPPRAVAGGGLSNSDAQVLRAGGIDPATVRCNGYSTWSKAVAPDSKAGAEEVIDALGRIGVSLSDEQRAAAVKEARGVILWRLIRTLLLDGNYNNVGVVSVRGLKTADGKPVLLFRSGLTPLPDTPESCYSSLVGAGGVRHVLNLYNGAIPTRDIEEAEARAVRAAGGSYFLAVTTDPGAASWRTRMREDPSAVMRERAMKAVARVINDHILRPDGKLPTGNILVHCGGGMHRTGMLVGVVQRCLNGDDADTIAAAYKRHTSYRGAEEPGGFEQENLDFVQAFDCALLNRP